MTNTLSISKNANKFRYVFRCLCYHSLNRCISSLPLPQFEKTLQHGLPFRFLRRVLRQGFGIHSVTMYQGCPLSNSLSAQVVKSVNQASKTSGEGNSGKGENSGESNQNTDAGKPIRGGPVSWLSFLLLVATGVGIVFYYDREKRKHIEGSLLWQYLAAEIYSSSKEVKQGRSVGKAAIGGPFNLINHDGKSVTEKDLLGNWTLIYFGFTHCPDICPDELIKLAAAVDKIKQKAEIEILPVFISVDPERDTFEHVQEYVKEFHPKLIGLTGSAEEIRNVARAYRVYYMKTDEEDSDYLVDHSIVMYLMDSNMDFVKFFGKNNDVDSLADGIIKEIKTYKK